MSDCPNLVRPRSRAISASSPQVIPPEPETENRTLPAEAGLDLPVLARLPKIAEMSDKTISGSSGSHGANWSSLVNWNLPRNFRTNPSYVAAAIVSVVLVLLLVIAVNRKQDPAQNHLPNQLDAPAFTASTSPVKAAPAPASGTLPANRGEAPPSANSIVQPSVTQSPQPSLPAATNASSAQPVDHAGPNLQGAALTGAPGNVFYPRTPYETPAGVMLQNAAAGSGHPNGDVPVMAAPLDTIRTAQRDRMQPPAPRLDGSAAPPAARFEGIITKPY